MKAGKIASLAIGVAIAITAVTCIIHTNIEFAQEPEQKMGMNEEVQMSSYSICVNSYEIVDADTMEQQYPGSKTVMTNQSTGEIACAFLVKCTIKINDASEGFPYSNLTIESGSFRQGISAQLINLLNPDYDFSNLEENGVVDMIIPYAIYPVQFPSDTLESVGNLNYRLMLSITPTVYVQLN